MGDVRDEEIYTGITNVQDESEEQFNCDGIGSSPSRIGTRLCEPPDNRPVTLQYPPFMTELSRE